MRSPTSSHASSSSQRNGIIYLQVSPSSQQSFCTDERCQGGVPPLTQHTSWEREQAEGRWSAGDHCKR